MKILQNTETMVLKLVARIAAALNVAGFHLNCFRISR